MIHLFTALLIKMACVNLKKIISTIIKSKYNSVCSDKHHWYDFCVYTTKGVIVERINPDIEWIQKSVPKLKDYFDNYILPELVYPMHKPSYFL